MGGWKRPTAQFHFPNKQTLEFWWEKLLIQDEHFSAPLSNTHQRIVDNIQIDFFLKSYQMS